MNRDEERYAGERAQLGEVLAAEHRRAKPGHPLAAREYQRLAWAVRSAVLDELGTFLAQAHYTALQHIAGLRAALQRDDLPAREQDARRKLLAYTRWQEESYRFLANEYGRPIKTGPGGRHPAAATYEEHVATLAPAELPLDLPCPQCGQPEVGLLLHLAGPLPTDLEFLYGCGVCSYRAGREVSAQQKDAMVRGLLSGDLRMVRRVLPRTGDGAS